MKQRHLLYISFLFLLPACTNGTNDTKTAYPRSVQVVQVKTLSTIDKSYTGFVQAEKFSILAFKISGSLTALNVTEGQKVEKGDIIARIDPLDYELQYKASQAAFETAKSIYERNKRLFTQNAVAAQNLEIAEADYIRAESAMNIAERTLSYTRLTAPFNGIIEKKFVENFQKVLVGESIVKLIDPEEIEIYFILPETNIQLIELPKTIYVEFDTQKGKLFTAGIKEYIYSSDGLGIPITLKITDQEFAAYRKNVLPGFSCKVTFNIENTISNNFIIPASALFTEQDKQYVQTVNPQTLQIERRQVEAVSFDDKSVIKKGLNINDLIVTAGVTALKEGQKVRIMKNTNE